MTVDGLGQASPVGPFNWRERPQAHLRHWVSTKEFDFADADHDAYRRLPDPVRHRRRVLFVKPRYWVVVDDLEGAAEHRVEFRFQFVPTEVTLEPALWTRARGADGHGLLVRTFTAAPLKVEIREGELDPPQGWVSPDYGRCRTAPVLTYSTVTRLPFRVVTLLLPVADVAAPPPRISLLLDGRATPAGLAFEEGGDEVRFHDKGLVSIRRAAPDDAHVSAITPHAAQAERCR